MAKNFLINGDKKNSLSPFDRGLAFGDGAGKTRRASHDPNPHRAQKRTGAPIRPPVRNGTRQARIHFRALLAIAKKALARDVGARALRGVVEEIMLELMYDLPEQDQSDTQFTITDQIVEGTIEATLENAKKA